MRPSEQPSATAERNGAVTLAHFSDVHVTAPRLGWTVGDLFSKRVAGWVNLRYRGRGAAFADADAVVTALGAELRARPADRVLFSGDATALGFEAEVRRAAELLGLHEPDPPPGLAVPGNHDYYVGRSARGGAFERAFAAWLSGEREDDATYPFAQRVGPLWLVGVNTASANHLPWDARGRAGADQRARLGRLLKRLTDGPRVLVTHYPVCRSCGNPEKTSHALRDLDSLVRVAADGGVTLWLHGHRHDAYHHAAAAAAPFPVVCAGSATQRGLWSYQRYAVSGRTVTATRRVYDPKAEAFRDSGGFTLEMPG